MSRRTVVHLMCFTCLLAVLLTPESARACRYSASVNPTGNRSVQWTPFNGTNAACVSDGNCKTGGTHVSMNTGTWPAGAIDEYYAGPTSGGARGYWMVVSIHVSNRIHFHGQLRLQGNQQYYWGLHGDVLMGSPNTYQVRYSDPILNGGQGYSYIDRIWMWAGKTASGQEGACQVNRIFLGTKY